jgi:hypothetical protein
VEVLLIHSDEHCFVWMYLRWHATVRSLFLEEHERGRFAGSHGCIHRKP